MAVSGGATSAYQVRLEGDTIHRQSTTTLKECCIKPQLAIEKLRRGETVLVAGYDMAKLNELIEGQH